jgi:4-amino-4-deoxy-L-arabinose transferase-like glycosyltransferase
MSAAGRARTSNAALFLLTAVGVAFFLAWEIAHRGVYLYTQGIYRVDDADEWRYTACSRLVVHGYRLFDQVFSAQPPLLFASLAAAMRVFGANIDGARWVELLFGLVALACAGWISSRLAGRWAAAAAVVLLSVSPGFLIYSHTVEAEVPMMALAALSLALLLEGRDASGTALVRWAVAGGLVLSAATLTKLFAAEALLPGLWVLVAWRQSLRAAARPVIAYLLAFVIPLSLDFALIFPSRQWQQVVDLHNRAASATLPDLIPAHTIVWNFLTLDAGLSAVAAAGIGVLALRRRRRELGFISLWLGGSIVMLLGFRPLFPHHAAILLVPLAVAAGAGIGSLVPSRPDLGFYPLESGRRVSYALMAAAALIYLIFTVRIAHDDRHALYASGPTASDALAASIVAHTSPTDLIATDDTRAADTADRLIAPPLCDPSTVRLKAGYLTASNLIDATRTYHVKLVAPATGLYAQVPAYISWLRAHYTAKHGPDGLAVYLRR